MIFSFKKKRKEKERKHFFKAYLFDCYKWAMHEVETIDHRHESLGVGPTAQCQQEETNVQKAIPLSASESCRIPHQSAFFLYLRKKLKVVTTTS